MQAPIFPFRFLLFPTPHRTTRHSKVACLHIYCNGWAFDRPLKAARFFPGSRNSGTPVFCSFPPDYLENCQMTVRSPLLTSASEFCWPVTSLQKSFHLMSQRWRKMTSVVLWSFQAALNLVTRKTILHRSQSIRTTAPKIVSLYTAFNFVRILYFVPFLLLLFSALMRDKK